MNTNIEINFYNNVLSFLREIKQLSLLSSIITLTFASNQDFKYKLLNKCEEWKLVSKTGSKENEQKNNFVVNALVTQKFDKALNAIDRIFDDPWLVDETRVRKINKLLGIKKLVYVDGPSKKLTEEWDRNSGVWTITIPDGKKPIEIKVGKQGAETNQTFSILYEMKDKDVKASDIWKGLSTSGNVKVGTNMSTLRKWIKGGLGQKYKDLIKLTYDRSTKTYKLELNF